MRLVAGVVRGAMGGGVWFVTYGGCWFGGASAGGVDRVCLPGGVGWGLSDSVGVGWGESYLPEGSGGVSPTYLRGRVGRVLPEGSGGVSPT